MAFSVTDFITASGDGARPTLFAVQLNWPDGVPANGANVTAPLLIKSTSVPQMSLGQIEVPFMGRTVKVAGDRTFDDWETTIINDQAYFVRANLEAWNNAINGMRSNVQSVAPLAYRSSAKVIQFDRSGVPIREYQMVNIWPQTIASIDLDWETTDTIEEFSVTWSYDYFTATGPTGSIGESLGERVLNALG